MWAFKNIGTCCLSIRTKSNNTNNAWIMKDMKLNVYLHKIKEKGFAQIPTCRNKIVYHSCCCRRRKAFLCIQWLLRVHSISFDSLWCLLRHISGLGQSYGPMLLLQKQIKKSWIWNLKHANCILFLAIASLPTANLFFKSEWQTYKRIFKYYAQIGFRSYITSS